MHEPFESDYETPTESPGFLLWQVTNLWQRRQRAALRDLDLTHVQFILLASVIWLTRDDQPVTQVQLALHTQTDVMMTSQVLRTLEEKSLIARTPNPRDTRANLLHATARGKELARQAIRLVEQVDREFFAVLGGDLAPFTRALQQLARMDDRG